jgi:sialate O-acetylesterase
MMKNARIYLSVLVSGFLLVSCTGVKQTRFELPAIISSNMVLQQHQEVVLWGKANPGSRVSAEASWNAEAETTTEKDSTWNMRIRTPEAGGPYQLTFTNEDSIVSLENVMIGEVWICSGQSNMEMPVMGWPPADTILHSASEIAAASFPGIRMFTVTRAYAARPSEACQGEWQVCSPETVGMFSATAYFFGKMLHQELGVPVGLIHSSWGGTPVESWMPGEKILSFSGYEALLGQLDSIQLKVKELDAWLATRPVLPLNDDPGNPWAGLDFRDEAVARPEFDHSAWKSTDLPGTFERSAIGQFDGAVWFRKTVVLPEKWAKQELVLELGPIDDMDVTYFNGRPVGGHERTGQWQVFRKYTIPAELVDKGENLIAVRVLDNQGGGGIYGKAGDLRIYPTGNPTDQIALNGEWKYLPVALLYNGSFRLLDIGTQEFYRMAKLPMEWGPHTPTVLFNAMIHPLVPYTLKGAIWYQGEANTGNPEAYAGLFPAMIQGWREAWKQGDFPFYFVQIAPFDYGSGTNSAALRDAQMKALQENATGMAVTLDIGNPVNIHPANKVEVGRRLALWALAKDYGRAQVYSGPLYAGMEVKGDAILVHFDHTDGGLKAGKGGLKHFTVAGEDRVFKLANATISGSSLIIKSSGIEKPVAVRYCWDNTSEASLFNGEGLPASSFRSDNW